MATLTIKTCDHCNKDDYKENVQFWTVTLGFSSGYAENVKLQELWCRECCIKTGIIKPHCIEDKDIPIIKLKPTLDDFIKDFIHDEVQEQLNAKL